MKKRQVIALIGCRTLATFAATRSAKRLTALQELEIFKKRVGAPLTSNISTDGARRLLVAAGNAGHAMALTPARAS